MKALLAILLLALSGCQLAGQIAEGSVGTTTKPIIWTHLDEYRKAVKVEAGAP